MRAPGAAGVLSCERPSNFFVSPTARFLSRVLTRLSDLNDQRNDLYCNNCVTDIGRCTGCRERKAERLQQLQEQLQQSEQSVLDMQAEAAMAKEKLREMELARMSVIQVSHQGPSFAAAAVLFSLPLLLPPQLLLLLPLLL